MLKNQTLILQALRHVAVKFGVETMKGKCFMGETSYYAERVYE